MHTVIIANEKMTRLFGDYRRLFDPFLKDGTISFCSWNEEGPDLDTALPDLTASMGDELNWRALIVHDPGAWQNEDGEEIFDEYNPYDYAVNREGSQLIENPVALVRLTHLLAGYPDLGVKEVVEKELDKRKNHELLEYRTEEYTPEEQRVHKRLQDKYEQLIHKPKELWLLSVRRRRKKMNRKDLREIWRNSLETESSMFWQRNNYPETCRFLCYDISDRENEYYTRELFEFWLTVLTLSLNRIPPSMLQAYRLYRVNCEIDRDELKEIFTDRYSRLTQAEDALTEAMKAAPKLSFETDEDILTRQEVPVVYDRSDEDRILIDTKEIGLSKDCPRSEAARWQEDFHGAKNYLTEYVKEPRRAIDRASQYTRSEEDSFFEEEYELDEIQTEEIEEIAWGLEEDILAAETMKLVDLKAYDEELKEANDTVMDLIRGRMTRRVTILSGLIAIAVYFCGFLPYLFQASKYGGSDTMQPSVKLVCITMACFLAAAFFLLFIFRRRVRNAMEDFNSLLRRIIQGINDAAEKFAEYLSLICTYMKAQSILQGTKRRRESVISYRGLLRMHRAAAGDFKDQISMWCTAYDLKIVNKPLAPHEEYYDFAVLPDDCELYYFEKNENEEDIIINTSGEKITSPYPFVGGLNIERQEIYDDLSPKQEEEGPRPADVQMVPDNWEEEGEEDES